MTTEDLLKITLTIQYLATLRLISYLVLKLERTEESIGREALNRNLRHTLRYGLVGALVGCGLNFIFSLLGEYRWVSFNIFIIGVIAAWAGIWIYSKRFQKFGNLLFNMGRTSFNKDCHWIGVTCLIIVSLRTWQFYLETPTEVKQSLKEISLEATSQLGFSWIITILFLSYSLSRIEFRENGICFMFMFLNWRRINHYNWERSKPNVLTVWFEPYFPLVQEYMSIAVNLRDRDAINEILAEQLPGKRREI